MRIIQFLVALTILLAPALASAQVRPYIEGQIGLLTSISDTDIKSADTDAREPYNLMFDLEHDADISFGAEIGVGEIAGTGFRVGLSYSQFGSDSKQKNPSGTVGDLTFEEALAEETEDDDTRLRDLEDGVEYDVTVKVLSLNVYHDFDIGSPVMPYVGLGIGQGTIEADDGDEDEMVVSLHAGANYDINENFYVGARASFHQVDGISWGDDTEKNEIDDLTIWSFGIVGGVRF